MKRSFIYISVIIFSITILSSCQKSAEEFEKDGLAKDELSDYSGAIQDYNKAIEINHNYSYAYYHRGLAKYELKDFQGAVQDLSTAIQAHSNVAYTYYYRGLAKHELGDNIGACLDWSKAGELGERKAYDMIKEYCNK